MSLCDLIGEITIPSFPCDIFTTGGTTTAGGEWKYSTHPLVKYLQLVAGEQNAATLEYKGSI